MFQKLKAQAVNASPILEEAPLFMDVEVHKDEMYNEVFANTQDPDFHTYTQVALEMVLTGMVLILDSYTPHTVRA